jgi:pimeloyl-ACP methyl ester carboxylesterase
MGEVYRAKDPSLDRDVAIKVLPEAVAANPERVKRFEREAKAVAALNHPNVVTIHSVEETEGVRFLTMEVVEGTTLGDVIPTDGQPLGDFFAVAGPIVDALRRAHDRGIVHRDLKPGNVMVTDDGLVKVMDFGLAKLFAGGDIDDSAATETASQTAVGIILGTAAYMSPEQAEGKPVGPASDIFSLGTMFYEMLTGGRPFMGDSKISIMSAILHESPPALGNRRRDLPKDVVRIVNRCLEKSSEARYPSANELWQDLEQSRKRRAAAEANLLAVLRRPRVAVPALVILASVVAVGGWLWNRGSRIRWAEREALPEITRLTEKGDLYEAYHLALEARKVVPENAEVQKMLERITLPLPIVTKPTGADVFIKGYKTPEAPWEFLGRTPLEMRIPYALVRLKISKEGFETYEGAPFGAGPMSVLATGLPLAEIGERPGGMVRVPGGPLDRVGFPVVELGPYWLDRYEVTNREFKDFVDAGGYRRTELWARSFDDDGSELTWEQAAASFVDRTGRPGPATWEVGTYPEGQEGFPVTGVSWYEAAAYCDWAGKSLPTVFHWYGATSQDQLSDIVNLSNFGSDGPAPVGSFPGLGDWGTYDMAGNVKEWCWNLTGDKRYILGGAWGEPTYMFKEPDARLPLEREETYGFRCVRPIDAFDDALLDSVTPSFDYSAGKSVSDEIFEVYRRLYAYDRTEVDAEVDAVDESSPYWIKERVSFDAAYGDERVTALLFLPRDVEQPYQTVVWFPGDDVFLAPSSDSLASAFLFDFIPRSGRALVYPIYKGMYERSIPFSFAPNEWRDMMIMWSKDLGRTIDYLETREDIDHEKLAYYGVSSGAAYGPIFSAIDERFRANVLLSGGVWGGLLPEMDVATFAPRCHVPTLMINGRDDFILPVETSQRPLFELLGVPEDAKRHTILEGGHLPPDRRALIREILDWLDTYLGRVK